MHALYRWMKYSNILWCDPIDLITNNDYYNPLTVLCIASGISGILIDAHGFVIDYRR